MTARFHSRNGQRVERLSRLPSTPRFFQRGTGNMPSVSHGIRWRALPVEGSKAFRAAGHRPRILGGDR